MGPRGSTEVISLGGKYPDPLSLVSGGAGTQACEAETEGSQLRLMLGLRQLEASWATLDHLKEQEINKSPRDSKISSGLHGHLCS